MEKGKAKVLFYREAEKRNGKGDNRKNVYVCLIREGDEVIARGVSVCSKKDQLVKEVGRNMAQIRAEKAIEHGRNIGSLNRCGFAFDGYYKPELNERENRILNKAK
jgi:hypothetical protein